MKYIVTYDFSKFQPSWSKRFSNVFGVNNEGQIVEANSEIEAKNKFNEQYPIGLQFNNNHLKVVKMNPSKKKIAIVSIKKKPNPSKKKTKKVLRKNPKTIYTIWQIAKGKNTRVGYYPTSFLAKEVARLLNSVAQPGVLFKVVKTHA